MSIGARIYLWQPRILSTGPWGNFPPSFSITARRGYSGIEDSRSLQLGIVESATTAPCRHIWRGHPLKRQWFLGEIPSKKGSSRKQGGHGQCSTVIISGLVHVPWPLSALFHLLLPPPPQHSSPPLTPGPWRSAQWRSSMLILSSSHVLTVSASSASPRRGFGFGMASVISVRGVTESWFFPNAHFCIQEKITPEGRGSDFPSNLPESLCNSD